MTNRHCSHLRSLCVAAAVLACVVVGCRSKESTPTSQPESAHPSTATSAATPPSAPTITPAPPTVPDVVDVEQVDVPNDLPAFVVRGKTNGERMVFLHGLCGNPYAYALSFRNAAARIGTLVALQGNTSCGEDFRDWSASPAKVDTRIEAAFRAVGDTSSLRDVIVIGYSSGGTFAELLVMRNPERYARAVLIAMPQAPALFRLRKARGVVLMAGERDRHDLMKTGLRSLTLQSIPCKFLVLPGATHGEMGEDAERVMGEALDWLVRFPAPVPNHSCDDCPIPRIHVRQ